MNLQSIEAAVAKLPQSYGPLLLTFYRAPLKTVDGSVVIGTDDGVEFRVDLADGHVSGIDPRGNLPSRLVNSSLNQLAEAIAAYLAYAARVRGAGEAEAARLAQELRRQIAAIDAAATSDPEAWWSLILEHAEGGLL